MPATLGSSHSPTIVLVGLAPCRPAGGMYPPSQEQQQLCTCKDLLHSQEDTPTGKGAHPARFPLCSQDSHLFPEPGLWVLRLGDCWGCHTSTQAGSFSPSPTFRIKPYITKGLSFS